jgi:hypothetical protein
MTLQQEMILPEADSATVSANWLRDDVYLHRSVQYGFFERVPGFRFLMPLLAGVAVFLWFSHWGLMHLIFGLRWQWSNTGMVVGTILLLVSSWATMRNNTKVTQKGYEFRGDAANWQFSERGVSYSLAFAGNPNYPQPARLRHTSQSQWSWYNAISANCYGLRLHRSATQAYVIPVTSLKATDQSLALQQVLGMARSAGLSVRETNPSHWPTTIGCTLMMALMLLLILSYNAMQAAWPLLRYGRIDNVWYSALGTFWWVALLASPVLVSLHFLLARWLHGAHSGSEKLHYFYHALLGLTWGLVVVLVMQATKAWIFDDALSGSQFLTPFPILMAVVSGSLAAQLLFVHGVSVWSAWFTMQQRDVPQNPH